MSVEKAISYKGSGGLANVWWLGIDTRRFQVVVFSAKGIAATCLFRRAVSCVWARRGAAVLMSKHNSDEVITLFSSSFHSSRAETALVREEEMVGRGMDGLMTRGRTGLTEMRRVGI